MYWGFHWVLLSIMNFCECSLFWEICINSLLGIIFHIVLYVHLNSYFFIFLLFNLFDSVRDMLKSIPIPIVDLPTFHFLSVVALHFWSLFPSVHMFMLFLFYHIFLFFIFYALIFILSDINFAIQAYIWFVFCIINLGVIKVLSYCF